MTKIVCDLRDLELDYSAEQLTDKGYIACIESALLDRIGKVVVVEIRVQRTKKVRDESREELHKYGNIECPVCHQFINPIEFAEHKLLH